MTLCSFSHSHRQFFYSAWLISFALIDVKRFFFYIIAMELTDNTFRYSLRTFTPLWVVKYKKKVVLYHDSGLKKNNNLKSIYKYIMMLTLINIIHVHRWSNTKVYLGVAYILKTSPIWNFQWKYFVDKHNSKKIVIIFILWLIILQNG